MNHNGQIENDSVSGYHLQIFQILWNRGDLLLRRKYDRCTGWKRNLRREDILRAGKWHWQAFSQDALHLQGLQILLEILVICDLAILLTIYIFISISQLKISQIFKQVYHSNFSIFIEMNTHWKFRFLVSELISKMHSLY